MSDLFDELVGRFMSKREAAEMMEEMTEGALRHLDKVYGASPIKRRRGSRAEVELRRRQLRRIVARMQPMTVRQVFYQAEIRGLIPKSETSYKRIQNDLVLLRRAGTLPFDWIADNTRWQRKPLTFRSPQEAADYVAKLYRKSLWARANVYVEFWLEKDALVGVVYPVTAKYDVPLMVARGYASLSFLHSAARSIASVGVPAYIYHLGDFDPSGVNAAEKIEQELRRYAPDAEIHFQRIAVTEAQIALWNLPTRPTKKTDSRARGFGETSVELDAIEPGRLRALVEEAVLNHLPERELKVLKVAEDSEREMLVAWSQLLKKATAELDDDA